MKQKISLTLLFVLLLSLAIVTFTGCESKNNNVGSANSQKQVPVYQGMSITKSNSNATTVRLGREDNPFCEVVLLGNNSENNGDNGNNGNNENNGNNGNNGDNGNHYGHYKGDYADRNDMIDEENPYPDNGENENIEEEIKSSLDVIGSHDEIYYATSGEDIYINIHISNPDSFEIMSFTLNGKKYSSYMFEAGSDMETIVLKYNVGDASGIVEYTIDAIKYIDGTEIKDVLIDGDKTVMAGVKTENQVDASVTDVEIDTNALSFSVNIKDTDDLIKFSQGSLIAVLYDGFEITAQKELSLGENSVSFEGLKTNALYQYAVVGSYDDLSGGGFGMNILYKEAFYTGSVVLFDNITVKKDAISFGYLWHEDHKDKEISALKLYKGDNFVKDIDAKSLEINELLSNTGYKLVAEYPNGDNTESIYIEFTTLAKETPDLAVSEISKGKDGFDFSVSVTDTDLVGAITKVELIHGEDATLLENLEEQSINNLLSDNDYTVKVTYTYDLNDGEGKRTLVRELNVKTQAKAIPEISVQNPTVSQTSVGFEVVETDIDNVGVITNIELVGAKSSVVADSLDQRIFESLLSDNDYTVKVTYTYDLNDGEGKRTLVRELNVKTQAKEAPEVAVGSVSITDESIDADCVVTDDDNVLSYCKTELYKGDDLLSESINGEINFTGLNYYTDYTVKITYKYDLSDGKGEQTAVHEYAFKTLPYIDVADCNIANTSAVSEGETIFMQVMLNNPLGMAVESVVVNGETYTVTGASTKNKIFVEILYNGQFAGGDTYLKIDKVNAKIDSTNLSVEPKTELSDNVFINGKLDIVKIEFVNEAFDPVDWAFPSEKVYVMITLDNPTGYNLDSVGSITDLVKVDDDHWYYEVESFNRGWTVIFLPSLSYSLNDFSKTISYSDIEARIYKVLSDEIKYISSPEDLKNMNEGYYYELTNDIDLSGLEWLGNRLYGVFNGNGYSIKNMSFVGTVTNSEAKLGLFSNGCGVIQNLNIENATIIADVVSNDGNDYLAYCGCFVAQAEMMVIDNCGTDEYSTVGVTNNTKEETYLGGFIGYSSSYNENIIRNSQNSATIVADSTDPSYLTGGLVGYIIQGTGISISGCVNSGTVKGFYSGGFIGFAGDYAYVGDTQIYIFDSVNSGIIEGVHIGGFIGKVCNNTAEYTSDLVISNCLNNGSVRLISEDIIDQDIALGGLVGSVHDAAIVVTDCIVNGNTTANQAFARVGDLFAYIESYSNEPITIENCYSLKIINGEDCDPCNTKQLNSKGFYTETLTWSEDVWDFSSLDVENGKYPTLKALK